MNQITGGQIRMDAMLLENASVPLAEKEGEMKPHLEKAIKALEQAQVAIRASMTATTDAIVAPGEIKLMHQVEGMLKTLQNIVEKGLDQREDTARPGQAMTEAEGTLEKAVQAKLAELGFAHAKVPALEQKFKQILSGSIDPSELGKMAPVFKEISFNISVGAGKGDDGGEVAAIIVDYDWQHFRGHNGHKVHWQYENGAWKQWE